MALATTLELDPKLMGILALSMNDDDENLEDADESSDDEELDEDLLDDEDSSDDEDEE